MAVPQGNAIAYQAVKPVEATKVGDLYAGLIDNMIKGNQAKAAAELKRKTDEGKSLSDLMKDWKVDYKSTLAPFQDASNQSVKAAVDKIDFAKRIASDPNYSYEEKTKASMYAKNAMDGSLQLQTFLTNPEMVKNYTENLKLIGEGKAFRGDDRLGLYNSAAVGAWKSRFNDDGTIEVAYAKQGDTQDSTLEWNPLSDIVNKYSTPIEIDQTDEYNKFLLDSAQKITTETVNDNGVIKTTVKKFDEKDAKILLASQFGFDPNKPVGEQFSRNAVPSKLNHWYYQSTGKNIETNEDFEKAIDGSVEQMRASADEKVTREVKKTAAELEYEKLRNANLRKSTALMGRSSGSQGGSGGFTSVSPSMITKQDKVIVQIPGSNGEVKGTQMWAANTIPLPKVKNYPASNNTFGVAKFTNAAGKEVTTIIMGSPSDNGKMVYGKISPADFTNYVSKSGYDPYDTLTKLTADNNSFNRYTGKVDTTKKVYNKVKIGYNAKQVKDDEEELNLDALFNQNKQK